MLTIRCSACKRKLLKYNKLGKGEVHRCHKSRIDKLIEACENGCRLRCPCGAEIGIDKGSFYKMIRKAFTYTGAKVSKL
jgi:hypothetical protein